MQVMPATAANLLISIPNVAHLESRSVITQAAFGVAANGGGEVAPDIKRMLQKKKSGGSGNEKGARPTT